MAPEITRVETIEFTYPLEDVGTSPQGTHLVYEPGSMTDRTAYGIRIHTDTDDTGEYVGANPPAIAQINMVADYLVGQNPLKRERHWSELKRALRKYDHMGIGPVDIALWDFAGKRFDAPIHELLGTYRERLPAYISTYFSGPNGGFDSPEAFADFAEESLDMGFSAFKIHPWSGVGKSDIDREIETVRAVGERVGDDMDLMLDPVCEYETFGDALKVGKACDEQGYFWYEDPYGDGGRSQHGHRKLREFLETPLLMTEMVRGLESHTDFIAADGTDFVRADPEWDGGVTGAMKIARAAEGFGLDVELHLSGPAQRHCMAAMRNSNYYELGLVHPENRSPHTEASIYAGGYTDAMAAAEDGTYPVPDGPGLGVEYDWDYIDARAVDRRSYE